MPSRNRKVRDGFLPPAPCFCQGQFNPRQPTPGKTSQKWLWRRRVTFRRFSPDQLAGRVLLLSRPHRALRKQRSVPPRLVLVRRWRLPYRDCPAAEPGKHLRDKQGIRRRSDIPV
jgi:hypothetical protein